MSMTIQFFEMFIFASIVSVPHGLSNAMSLFKLFKPSESCCRTGVRPAFIFNCHFTVCENGVRPAYLTTTTNNNNNNDRNQDDFKKDLRADETFGSCVHVCAHRELNSLPAPDHFFANPTFGRCWRCTQ